MFGLRMEFCVLNYFIPSKFEKKWMLFISTAIAAKERIDWSHDSVTRFCSSCQSPIHHIQGVAEIGCFQFTFLVEGGLSISEHPPCIKTYHHILPLVVGLFSAAYGSVRPSFYSRTCVSLIPLNI